MDEGAPLVLVLLVRPAAPVEGHLQPLGVEVLQERVQDRLELGNRGLVLACEAGLRVPQSTQEEWIGSVDDVSALPLEHVNLPVWQPVLRVLNAHAANARA